MKSIYQLSENLRTDKLQNVYCLAGEDLFELELGRKKIENAVMPLVESDFDKEVIDANKQTEVYQITDLASAFPFGSGKKLIIVKNFEEVKNKKQISQFVSDPPEFLILVLVNAGKVNGKVEPWKTLESKGQLFEAKNPRKHEWANWVINRAEQFKLKISRENAQLLVETVGEDKSLIDMQLRKIADFTGANAEITTEILDRLASSTKEFSIFDLLNSLSVGDKPTALKIGFNILDNGKDLSFIIPMLSKYIMTIAQSFELERAGVQEREAAGKLGVSPYYYINCKNAKFFNSDKRLFTAARALADADLTLKTSNAEPKSIFSILISEMLK